MRKDISELPSVDALFAAVPHAMAVRAALELGIFSSIGDSTRSADELGARLQVDPDRLSRLLFALASIGFLTIVGEGFRNSALGSAFHDASKPGYRGDEHSLLRELWSADLMTAESLRTRQPAALRDFSDGADALQFSRTLAPGGLAFGRLLGQLVDFSDVGSVIDIGGGAGTTLIGCGRNGRTSR